MEHEPDFSIKRLGECRIPSPMTGVRFTGDDEHILYHSSALDAERILDQGRTLPRIEAAGPGRNIFFEPAQLACGIVTCGGLCPGLNDVIRAIVLSLFHHYGVRKVYGFRYGYEGFAGKYGHTPLKLTPELVTHIHERGGTILGSSRGRQDVTEIVDTLVRMEISILFTIGGDGTLRSAHAITEEIERRGLRISVIGIPKTIDNDISYIQKSFGFETAVSEADRAVNAANVEAEGARNGIGLVKLMGREAGFIAAFATIVNSMVNFCLVPEVPFTLEGFLPALRKRIENRGHAVIAVAEGAGQDLMRATGEKDASGNLRFSDIGLFLRDGIRDYFAKNEIGITLKYIDPSYMIRSVPPNPHDAAFCLLLGHNAVHAGMQGRTDMVVGFWNQSFTHVPILLAVSERRRLKTDGWIWNSVLASTGQPPLT